VSIAIDYYACLGLPLTSTGDEIRNAYRQVARRVHPDRFATNEKDRQLAVSLFTEWVAPSYRVLSTESVRAQFDKKYRDTISSQVSLGLPKHFLIERLQNASSPATLRQVYEQEVQNIFNVLYTDLQQASAQVELLSALNRAYVVVQLLAPWQKKAAATGAVPRLTGDRFTSYARQMIEQNKIADAFRYLRASESQIADRGEYHYLLGVCYLKRGTPTAAQTEFVNALEYNPQHVEANQELKRIGATAISEEPTVPGPWWENLFGALKRLVTGTPVGRALIPVRGRR
jgi:curved DNA-binding protein CbpA